MDPTYPLIPIVNLVAVFLILLTLLASLRKAWNSGLLMLCTWLFLGCIIPGFETIIWSNNADNKAPVWCDISSHIALGVSSGVPACSLVITRHLCNIARMRAVDAPSKRERRIQCFFDLFIGIGIPIIVMGPFFYVVQAYRFVIYKDVGCVAAEVTSGLSNILVDVWPVILPLISAVFYCPRIVWIFYRQHKEVNAFLRSNGTVDRAGYFRILAVGCLDILFTLPTGVLLAFVTVEQYMSTGSSYPFYPGWYRTHHPWGPLSVTEWRSDFWSRFEVTFQEWLNPVLSILIFAIFGLTGEARSTYRRWFWSAARPFGIKPPVREDVADMSFGSLQQHQWTQAQPGHSLSISEYSTTDDADLSLPIHSARQHEVGPHNGDLANEVMDIWCEEHDSEGTKKRGEIV